MASIEIHSEVIGAMPYRLALAGGWIDQPLLSEHNPDPPGSMVVVAIEPHFWCLERAGMATGTRKVARELWGNRFPQGSPCELIKELYEAENRDRSDPSGSQDMIGLLYPGINRLDFDFHYEGGIFPKHIEAHTDEETATWLEDNLHMLPVAQRPHGYNPLGRQNLDPSWIARLGQTGKDCFSAIVGRDAAALGESMNECMTCWEAILPDVVRHETLEVDLLGLLREYQAQYPGAMYSGCGGGYLYVVSDQPVPGSIRFKIRTS